MKDQDLFKLIEYLIELDEEIKKRLEDLRKLVERDRNLSVEQQEIHFIV